MKIEEGKYYRARNGGKIGPAGLLAPQRRCADADGTSWNWLLDVSDAGGRSTAHFRDDGTCPYLSEFDAVEEWSESNWQPIETAPKDGTWILVVCKGFIPAVVAWDDTRNHWSEAEWSEDANREGEDDWILTHWQPLPKGP